MNLYQVHLTTCWNQIHNWGNHGPDRMVVITTNVESSHSW